MEAIDAVESSAQNSQKNKFKIMSEISFKLASASDAKVTGFMKAIEILGRVNELLITPCKYGTTICTMAIAVIVILGVIFRYLLNDPLSWYEEASKYLLVWVTFFAAPIVLKSKGFANISLFTKMLPDKLRLLNSIFIYLLLLIFMTALLVYGANIAWNARTQTPFSMNFSFFFIYLSIPFGSALMLLITIEFILRDLNSLIKRQPNTQSQK